MDREISESFLDNNHLYVQDYFANWSFYSYIIFRFKKNNSVSIIYWIYWMVIVMILTIRQPAFKLIFYTPDDKEVKHIFKLNLNKSIVLLIYANQNKECRYLGITTLESIKTRKSFLINHIYDASYSPKRIIDLSKVTFIREKERIYLNFPRLKKLLNNRREKK